MKRFMPLIKNPLFIKLNSRLRLQQKAYLIGGVFFLSYLILGLSFLYQVHNEMQATQNQLNAIEILKPINEIYKDIHLYALNASISLSEKIDRKSELDRLDGAIFDSIKKLVRFNALLDADKIEDLTREWDNFKKELNQGEKREGLNSLDQLTQPILNLLEFPVQSELRELFGKYNGSESRFDAFQKLQENSNRILDEESQQLNKTLKESEISASLSVAIPLLFILLIGGLGALFIRTLSLSINQLSSGMKRFNAGDLRVRLPVYTHDELGGLALSFNAMADHIEKVITQQKNLLRATKRLANGEFSARVNVLDTSLDELKDVGFSFNEMASSFEEMILEIERMGTSLNETALEIQERERSQESIIVNQEKTTKEIAETADEIATSAHRFAKTVQGVSGLSKETSKIALSGKDKLAFMQEKMQKMIQSSHEMVQKLHVLGEKASHITTVVTSIAKLSDLTNLLSLNAAIEAEKAGESGKSFSHIAREIRNLADQSAHATVDIEKIVTEMMSAFSKTQLAVRDFTVGVETGGKEVREVSVQLTKIIEQVSALTAAFESVDLGMQEQLKGAEKINRSLRVLSQMAKSTSDSNHHIQNSVIQLNATSHKLQRVLNKITKDRPSEESESFETNDKIMGLITLSEEGAQR